jgi:hypothetical protein
MMPGPNDSAIAQKSWDPHRWAFMWPRRPPPPTWDLAGRKRRALRPPPWPRRRIPSTPRVRFLVGHPELHSSLSLSSTGGTWPDAYANAPAIDRRKGHVCRTFTCRLTNTSVSDKQSATNYCTSRTTATNETTS